MTDEYPSIKNDDPFNLNIISNPINVAVASSINRLRAFCLMMDLIILSAFDLVINKRFSITIISPVLWLEHAENTADHCHNASFGPDHFTGRCRIGNGVEIGQWAEYRIDISSGGDESMSEYVDSIVDGVKKQFNESGFDLDKTISIRYTVASISGDLVTFDRTVKIAPDSQTKEKFRFTILWEDIPSENMIDKALLDSIRVEKLESVRYDLTEFSPTGFFIMPTNLEFGSKFEGETGLGEITFYSISDQRGDRKSNLFTAHDVAEQDVRSGVVTNTLEFDNIGEWEFDRESGILVGTILDMEITNWNTYESGWVSIGISRLDSSDDLKQKNIQRYHHSRPEILERLSYLFVEYDDSRYLLTNQVDSVGKPAKTTFDIINRKDNSEIGGVILHGDNLITSVTSFTVFTGSHTSDANDIHTMIRQSLLPECCGNLPTHNALFSDTIDEKYAS